jgi:hypothetical protein
MKVTFSEVSVLAALLSARLVAAQGLTIPEALAQHGASLGRSVSVPSGDVPSVEQVLSSTHLIVRGVVTQTRSYLSPDEREVYTDYEIRNPNIQYRASGVAIDKGGALSSITVTLLGGTIELNGLQFKSTHTGLPNLASGEEHILLLEETGGRYFIAEKYFGAFRIVDGHVEPSVRKSGFAKEFKGRPATETIGSLTAAARAQQRNK